MGQLAIRRSRPPVIRSRPIERQAGVWRPGVPGGAPGRALAHARLARQDGESPVRRHRGKPRGPVAVGRQQRQVAQARAARRRGGRAGPVGSDTARSLRAAGTQPGSRSQTVTASGRWGSYCRRTVVWSNPSGTSYRAPCQRTWPVLSTWRSPPPTTRCESPRWSGAATPPAPDYPDRAVGKVMRPFDASAPPHSQRIRDNRPEIRSNGAGFYT